MNANGFDLIRAVEQGDKEMITKIDRCAFFARTQQRMEVAAFNVLAGKPKITAEALTVHLLCRLLDGQR